MSNIKANRLHIASSFCLVGLIILGIAWETFLSPVKPGSYIFALKVLPLLFAVKGVLQRNIYTMQWSSMLILLYFMEGIVRAMGDADMVSKSLAGIEILLCLGFFFASILYVRPYKKLAKLEKTKSAQSAQIEQ